jgi:hypothetical protein
LSKNTLKNEKCDICFARGKGKERFKRSASIYPHTKIPWLSIRPPKCNQCMHKKGIKFVFEIPHFSFHV